ncbi:unnamed protein product [Pseudo-nitzschia multistriata]|uniref:HhH-GPD domain-containing protein n=1 Tax=Pseudo-nitzschia multistriata TaxID=183589 RepID=A0A448ZN22_9STRA|nr:unnamed protein product [Pseudo-nitzschia multistriata]
MATNATTRPSKIEKDTSSSDRCISRFFRPKRKPSRDEENDLKLQRENDVIILGSDDDTDDETDDPSCDKNDSVDVANEEKRGPEKPGARCELNTNIEILDDDDPVDACDVISQKEKVESNRLATAKEEDESLGHSDRNFNGSNLDVDTDGDTITTKRPRIASPQKPSVVAGSVKENPFARFAYSASDASEDNVKTTNGLDSLCSSWQRHSFASKSKLRKSNIANQSNDIKNVSSSRIRVSLKQKQKDFVKIKDISPEEQSKIIRKWQSMADSSAPLEVRRYQVLLAARLHARCQEVTVRKAMKTLRDYFSSLAEPKMVTVSVMANIDPGLLASHISNLQFYNAKAKQIVKAAQELLERHRGIVPEDECSLLKITGIGKTFADLLAFVNTREAHKKFGECK